MIDAAFSLGGDDFAIFCLRCLRDFADRSKALESFLPTDAVSQTGALLFSGLTVDLCSHFAENLDWQQLDTVLERLDSIKRVFPGNGEIALNEASAAFNVATLAGKTGDWRRVEDMFGRFDALRQEFPDNVEIALNEAEATVNFAADTIKAKDWPKVDTLLERLDALRQGRRMAKG